MDGCAAAHAIIETTQHEQSVSIVVVPDSYHAENMEREMHFFSPSDDPVPVWRFPDREILPYDVLSPEQVITATRLRVLHQLPRLSYGVCIVALPSLLHRLPPTDYVGCHTLFAAIGDSCDLTLLQQQLTINGYQKVTTTYSPGEFSCRGAIIDIFPGGSDRPYRIEVCDERIESMRSFDAHTQRSYRQLDKIELLPSQEVALNSESIALFAHQWHKYFPQYDDTHPLFTHIIKQVAVSGIENYLPLFFTQTATLFDYLPPKSHFYLAAHPYDHSAQTWQDIKSRYADEPTDSRPRLPPTTLFLSAQEICTHLDNYPCRKLRSYHGKSNSHSFPDIRMNQQHDRPLKALVTWLSSHSERVLICLNAHHRKQSIMTLLEQEGIGAIECENWQSFVHLSAKVALTIGDLMRGQEIIAGQLTIITENELFDQIAEPPATRTKITPQEQLLDMHTLHCGDLIIHREHGVGRYIGLETIAHDDYQADYFKIQYARAALLFVPISAIDLLSRCMESTTPLNILGDKRWKTMRNKAQKKIHDMAAELLQLYAHRRIAQGTALATHADYHAFAKSCPFVPTADQQAAIDTTLADLEKPHPMNRLICGDVGFGKTEIAMHAAFIAAIQGKQVVVLAPTTILAQQHYDSFCDRFIEWPIRIHLLSRSVQKKAHSETLTQVEDGRCDILIGTHRILRSDIHFHQLGLVIIDEEHRFGVRDKEKLNALRETVNVFTLSATPIPRTLHQALEGFMDISLITTPPPGRLPIKSFIREYTKNIVQEAIQREHLRGGQVYYLHNQVATIENAAQQLREWFPHIAIGVAHGQSRTVAQVMRNFYRQHIQVLVCSTIIESGIHIANANTIIINNAHLLGLAQLHQLRGRVGRGKRQAYSYFLFSSVIKKDALKRLQAIGQHSEIGSGLALALHDLEMRGAGDILGKEQSGHIQGISYSLYLHLLQQTIQLMRESPDDPLMDSQEVDIELPCSALIPSDYLSDVNLRLVLYNKIGRAQKDAEFAKLRDEIADRFGKIPPAVDNLLAISALKKHAFSRKIRTIHVRRTHGFIQFKPEVHMTTLVEIIQRFPQRYRITPDGRLTFVAPPPNRQLRFIRSLLNTLQARENKDVST